MNKDRISDVRSSHIELIDYRITALRWSGTAISTTNGAGLLSANYSRIITWQLLENTRRASLEAAAGRVVANRSRLSVVVRTNRFRSSPHAPALDWSVALTWVSSLPGVSSRLTNISRFATWSEDGEIRFLPIYISRHIFYISLLPLRPRLRKQNCLSRNASPLRALRTAE